MNTQINSEDLELLRAIQTIKKYHEREYVGHKNFNQNVWTLVEALLQTASKQHTCPNCGSALKLYILY